MIELFERLFERLRLTWSAMSLNQRVLSSAAFIAVLISSLFISTLGDRMQSYTVLFAQLDASSANEITLTLEQQNVPFRLIQGGTAIEVPVDQADRLKIQMTAEGLPGSGIVGYEILDTTNFGLSDFLQKTNYRRAMEGELIKTLRTLEEVEDARVHLVIPEPSLFTDSAEQPTASVVLKLRRGRALPRTQVEGIANLIASAAVEGLDPSNVTILDTQGNQLSKPVLDDIAMQSSTLMELKFTYENVLANKVKSMLDGAFGTGLALITVNADLNYDRIERMTTSYDQDDSAIFSEERSETTNPTADGGGEEITTTNYNTGSIVESLIKSPGSSLERLSVSVLIDGRDSTFVDGDGVEQTVKVAWNDVQMASIRSISEAAVGFVPARDRLEVVSMPFGAREVLTFEGGGGAAIGATVVESVKVLTTGFAIIAAIAMFFVITRSLAKTLDPSKITIAAEKEFKKHEGEIEEEEYIESDRSKLIKRIMTKAAQDTDMAAKTIRTIYREE